MTCICTFVALKQKSMSLEHKITDAIKTAMKAKDKESLNALRAIKSAILLAKTEKSDSTLDEKAEIAILQKLQKQRKESAAIYHEQCREELAAEEEQQRAIIEQFLPKPFSTDELERIIEQVIEETGASSPADMGKVMGKANAQIAGRADGKTIADTVKRMLS